MSRSCFAAQERKEDVCNHILGCWEMGCFAGQWISSSCRDGGRGRVPHTCSHPLSVNLQPVFALLLLDGAVRASAPHATGCLGWFCSHQRSLAWAVYTRAAGLTVGTTALWLPFDVLEPAGTAGSALLALLAHPGDTHLYHIPNEEARLNLLLVQTHTVLVDWCLSFPYEKQMLVFWRPIACLPCNHPKQDLPTNNACREGIHMQPDCFFPLPSPVPPIQPILLAGCTPTAQKTPFWYPVFLGAFCIPAGSDCCQMDTGSALGPGWAAYLQQFICISQLLISAM